jgi:hypothetical protein
MARRTIDQIAALTQRFIDERIRPFQDAEESPLSTELSSASVRPAPRGRRLNMARRVRARTAEQEVTGDRLTPIQRKMGHPIYAWPVVGSAGVSGLRAKYTVLLWTTGEISCDCPGWINYHSKKGELACKHTKIYDSSRATIMRMWRNGEALPTTSQAHDSSVEVQNGINPNARNPTPSGNSGLLLGRTIDL